MRFAAGEIQVNTLKKGLKLTLFVSEDSSKEVLKDIYNFIDRPLTVTIDIDSEKRLKELNQISGQQRKKIYALFGDIDNYTGQGIESIKREMKLIFLKDTGYQDFSLSDCSSDLANDFIEFLIGYCFKNGVELTDLPSDSFEDPKRYMALCIKTKICAVCGKKGEEHHYTAIGMGRDRNKVDDSDDLILSLCRLHHEESHLIGRETFIEKYHLQPARKGDLK